MFGVPADTGWVWLGLLVGSAAMFGVITDIHATPPDAERVARAVDAVAAGSHSASGSVAIDAESIDLGPRSVSVRGPGGTSHARFDYGPITPVPPDSDLERVLEGHPPRTVFDTPAELEAALEQSASSDGGWRPVETGLTIRRVQYGEVDCVLVGA